MYAEWADGRLERFGTYPQPMTRAESCGLKELATCVVGQGGFVVEKNNHPPFRADERYWAGARCARMLAPQA
jgi:hypothetical protein